ncbi:MAG TPA: ATP-binding protein [Kineosporiaceae bacterium]
MLHLVLVILLSTALKFTRPRARADIEVGSLCQQSECIVFVRDNGVGFESCHADTVLDVFLRLHLREEFEGTGVGLASVRRIIDRHGGRTWTEGALDRGATTYFSCRRSMATHLGVGRRLEVGDGVHGEVVPDGGRGCGPY